MTRATIIINLKEGTSMSSHADAILQSKTLGEVSDANLIHYFKTELKLIGEGQRATILPDSVIQNFLRLGILEYISGPRGHTLSAKGREVISRARPPVETSFQIEGLTQQKAATRQP